MKNKNYSFSTPGIVDFHMNGGFLVNITGASLEELEFLRLELAKSGITAFLPTIITDDEETMKQSIKNILRSFKESKKGCEILGIYLEGPFISVEKRGCHPEAEIQEVSEDLLEDFLFLAEDLPVILAIAPELEGALELIKKYEDQVLFGLGHSMAGFEETEEALKSGGKFFVHLMNAMRSFHHREPGILGRALLEKEAKVEFIGDGFHILKDFLPFLKKNYKKEQLILISDASPLAGLERGKGCFGDQKIFLKDGKVLNDEGIISGSSRLLSQMVEDLLKEEIFNLEEIIQMTHDNPLELLNLDSLDHLTLWNEENKIIGSKINGKYYFKE